MFHRLRRTDALRFILCLALPGTAGAQSAVDRQLQALRSDPWPGFRGPFVTGATGADLSADDAELGLEVAWKRPIGSGYSGIAVGADRLVTMFAGGDFDVIAAFDPASGAELWRWPISPAYLGHDGSFSGPISTPFIHGEQVIALGPRGRLFALDIAGGALLWSLDLGQEFGARGPPYGFGTSPIVVDGTLIVQVGGTEVTVAGLDPASGRIRWTAGSDIIGYQSAVPITLEGRVQVLATGFKQILGLDPRSGEQLWRYEHGGTGSLGAGKLVPIPVGDGRVFLAFKDDASTVVKLTPSRPDSPGERLWEARTIRNSWQVPVYYDGYVFGFSSRFLTSVDVATGEATWKSRPPGDGFPILVGRHLVVLTKNGSLHVIDASPDGYRERAALQVFEDELAWSPPSFGFGSLFVRSLGELARVDVRPLGRTTDVEGEAGGEPPAGSRFAAYLDELEAASDKAAVIDAFLAAQSSFPIVEGQELVHFVYRGPAQDVSLAGDVIGSRYEVPMRRVEGTDFFYYSVHLEPDARINYRFIRDFEAILDPRNDRETLCAVFDAEMDLVEEYQLSRMSWLAMPAWEPPAHLSMRSSDTPRGRLVERTFTSEALESDQTVQIYLPPGYDEGDGRYPVAYYHGGAAAISVGEIPRSLDNLIAEGQPPVIAVFMDEPPFLGRGAPLIAVHEAYSRMWARELVPLIDASFRTIAEPSGRAAVGGGRYAYLAAYATLQEPGVTTKLGLQSIHMTDARRIVLAALASSYQGSKLDVYIDWGTYDAWSPRENWDHRPRNRDFAALLKELGHEVEGGEVHDGTGWSSWQNRTDRVYRALFQDR